VWHLRASVPGQKTDAADVPDDSSFWGDGRYDVGKLVEWYAGFAFKPVGGHGSAELSEWVFKRFLSR
jgi:hypothetical protein